MKRERKKKERKKGKTEKKGDKSEFQKRFFQPPQLVFFAESKYSVHPFDLALTNVMQPISSQTIMVSTSTSVGVTPTFFFFETSYLKKLNNICLHLVFFYFIGII